MSSSRKKLMLTHTKWVLDKKKCFILFIIFEIIWASDFWLYLITLSLNTWRYNSTFLFSRFGTITVKRTRPTNFWGRNILWSTGSLFLPQRTRSNSLSGSFVPCSCQITNIMERSIKYMHVANDLKITSKCNRLYPCIVVVKRFPLMHNILFSDWWHCLVFISSLSQNSSSVAKYSPAAGPRIERTSISYLGETPHLDLPHGSLRPDWAFFIHQGSLMNGKQNKPLIIFTAMLRHLSFHLYSPL